MKEERYAPPKRSITPEESTFAGEAVGAGAGDANVSTAAKHTTGNIARHPEENETMSLGKGLLEISRLTAGGTVHIVLTVKGKRMDLTIHTFPRKIKFDIVRSEVSVWGGKKKKEVLSFHCVKFEILTFLSWRRAEE